MALRETLELDLGKAQAEIDELERAIDRLSTSVDVNLDVNTRGLDQADRESTDLRQELDRVEDAADRVADQGDRIGREYKQGTDQAEQGLKGMGGALKGFIAIAATGLVADRIVNFGKAAVGAASDLAESTGKAEVVFGDFSEQIFAFTDTAPEALGLSTQAALEMTGTFGNLFTALGLSQEAAADLAPEIVQLGADLASFNNLEVGDALEKLRSGLVGEIEPLRSLGISFNAADVERKAFLLGLGDVNGVLSESDKVLARYQLILEQTGNAQGDFARTSDGLANSQRTLAGQWENLQADIGEALIPALLDLIPIVERLIETIGPKLVDAAGNAAIAILGLVGVFDPLAQDQASALKVLKDLNAEWLKGRDPIDKFGVGLIALRKRGDLTTETIETLRVGLGLSLGEAAEGAIIALNNMGTATTSAGDNFSEFTDKQKATIGVFGDVDEATRLLNDTLSEYNYEINAATSGVFHAADGTRLHGRALAEAKKATEQVIDVADDYVGSLRDQEKAIKAVEDAQKNYVNTLRGLADPVFRAINSYQNYLDVLEQIDEDSQRSAEEQLLLVEAILEVDSAFSSLDSTNIEAAIDAVSTALQISREEAEKLLNELNLLDGRRFTSEFELRLIGTTDKFIPEGVNPGGGPTRDPFANRNTPGNAVVNIYGPTTPDLDTSVTRAAQIIGAVSGMVA